jgi:uncharacterized membrane protein
LAEQFHDVGVVAAHRPERAAATVEMRLRSRKGEPRFFAGRARGDRIATAAESASRLAEEKSMANNIVKITALAAAMAWSAAAFAQGAGAPGVGSDGAGPNAANGPGPNGSNEGMAPPGGERAGHMKPSTQDPGGPAAHRDRTPGNNGRMTEPGEQQ